VLQWALNFVQQPPSFIQSWDNNVKLELEVLKQFGPTAAAAAKRCKGSPSIMQQLSFFFFPFGAANKLVKIVDSFWI